MNVGKKAYTNPKTIDTWTRVQEAKFMTFGKKKEEPKPEVKKPEVKKPEEKKK